MAFDCFFFFSKTVVLCFPLPYYSELSVYLFISSLFVTKPSGTIRIVAVFNSTTPIEYC